MIRLSWGSMVSASCNQGVWYHQQRISWSNSGGLPTRDDKRLCCLVGLQGFSGQQLLWRSLLPSSQRLVELLASYGKCHDQLVVYIYVCVCRKKRPFHCFHSKLPSLTTYLRKFVLTMRESYLRLYYIQCLLDLAYLCQLWDPLGSEDSDKEWHRD